MASKYLITKNVLKEYDDFVIEKRSMGTLEVQPLREWITSKVIDIKKDKSKTKPDKIKILEFVYLTEQEYTNLIVGYGLKPVKDLLQRLNDYIGSKGDKYKSHYYTCISWFDKKGIKRIDTQKELPKQEVKPQKEYVPMNEEQKKEAFAKLNAFRTKLGNNGI